MIKLSNNEKLFILYTKGYFQEYENFMDVLLADEYDLEIGTVDEGADEYFAHKLYIKLLENKYIDTRGETVERHLVQSFYRISKSPLAPKNFYELIRVDIQWINVEGGIGDLDLKSIDKSVLSKMKLKDNYVSN